MNKNQKRLMAIVSGLMLSQLTRGDVNMLAEEKILVDGVSQRVVVTDHAYEREIVLDGKSMNDWVSTMTVSV